MSWVPQSWHTKRSKYIQSKIDIHLNTFEREVEEMKGKERKGKERKEEKTWIIIVLQKKEFERETRGMETTRKEKEKARWQ